MVVDEKVSEVLEFHQKWASFSLFKIDGFSIETNMAKVISQGLILEVQYKSHTVKAFDYKWQLK